MRTIEDILKIFPLTAVSDWTQHLNGHGWIKTTACADVTSYIEGIVSGSARVSGNALVSGNAQVFGNALVSGNAQVFGDSWAVSPLYIQGSRHAATNCSYGHISIGCEIHTFIEWEKLYKSIGLSHGYSPAEILEYEAIITLFAKIGR